MLPTETIPNVPASQDIFSLILGLWAHHLGALPLSSGLTHSVALDDGRRGRTGQAV